jgi:hypothetical protein
MKIVEIPINTLVDLQFYYLGEKHKVGVGLLYKNAYAVYVSAIKNHGKTIPALKLSNIKLVYKTSAGIYLFHDVRLRSISYNGQNLYVVESDRDAQRVNNRNNDRLFMGIAVAAKIITETGSTTMNCILKDIGATGMGILSKKNVDKLSKIEIFFWVNESTRETLVGNILHVYEFKNGKGFLYGCEFVEPNETIGKYVIRQQIKLKSMEEY